jgi:NOL1/NOP2/fmu family ribosome biogenesis protein
MTENRYFKKDMRSRDKAMESEHEKFPRYKEYMAKRDEIAQHRNWQHEKQMMMQPYRSMHESEMDSRRMSDYARGRRMDGTEYEHQSAFEIPHQDYASRGSNQYQMKYDRADYRGQGNSNSRRDYEPYGHDYYYPPLASQDYARGRSDYYDMNYDYARGGRGRNDYAMDYAQSEEKWKKDLHHWTEKLKKKDRFRATKEDIIASAKSMGIRFDEFTEDELYAVYLMMVSDYKAVANEFRVYLNMAKEWLMDDDVEVSPSEKLCIYYYEIVKGEGLDD